jgi:hypothetical protein
VDYSTLIGTKATPGSIKDWVSSNRPDAPSVLTEAQAVLFSGSFRGGILQAMRVREMRKTAPLSLTLGASSVALPTRFLDPIKLRNLTLDTRLLQRSEDWIEDMRSYESAVLVSGAPAYYAIYDEAFQFEVKADAAYTLRLLYYEKPAPLSVSNETNWLTDRYPHLLRAACEAVAFDYLHDDQNMARALGKLSELLIAIPAENELSRRGTEYETEIP